MNLNEETLVTPTFEGSPEENTTALSVWQQWLYLMQSIKGVSAQNQTPLTLGIESSLRGIMNASQPQPAPMVSIAPFTNGYSTYAPGDSDSEGGETDVTFDFTTEQVTFERRMLELAGVRTKGGI